MPELQCDRARLKAIVFDLDGTLYRQGALRRAMLLRLMRAHATRPRNGLRTFRVLGAYREAQERLRESARSSPASPKLAETQLRLACEQTNEDPGFAAECVARWIEQEPLALLARLIQPGLLEFLHACKADGLRLGVLSDYPADAKLKALGLDGLLDVVLAAQSPEVGVFKPHPGGLLLTLERLQASPSECLYVGDRADVDGPAAAAAGVACVILTQRIDMRHPRPWIQVAGYPQLRELLFGRSDELQPLRLAGS